MRGDERSVTNWGKLVRARGPATAKARFLPNNERRVAGTRADDGADRSRRDVTLQQQAEWHLVGNAALCHEDCRTAERTTCKWYVSVGIKGKSCRWNSISQLRSVTLTCHLGSRSVTCHPTQVKTPRLNPSETGWYSIYIPRRDGRLSWPRWLVKDRDGLPAHRRSPIKVVTRQCCAGNRTRNLLITSPTP